MKKEYTVSIPIAGAIHIFVTADDKEKAREAAWREIAVLGSEAGDVEWEFFEELTSGNVLNAPFSTTEVTETK